MVKIHNSLFYHLPSEGCLDYFQFEAIAKWLEAFMYSFFCEHLASIFQDKHPGVEFLGNTVILCLTFCGNSKPFSTIFPPVIYEYSGQVITIPAFDVVSLVNFSHQIFLKPHLNNPNIHQLMNG